MKIFELDDFSFWVDSGVAKTQGFGAFSPFFVFLIDWAYTRDLLSEELISCGVFQKAYAEIKSGKMKFAEFVEIALDGKLLTSYFKIGAHQFLLDYSELDGLTNDLSKHFKVNMWELPSDIDASRSFHAVIDKSLDNYKKNKSKNPEIVDFSDPK